MAVGPAPAAPHRSPHAEAPVPLDGDLRRSRPEATYAGPDDPERERRLPWAVLLQRTFGFEVLVCPKCSGPMRLVAAIEDPAIARKILDHLKLPSRAPPRGRPWSPQRSLALDRLDDAFDGVDPPTAFE